MTMAARPCQVPSCDRNDAVPHVHGIYCPDHAPAQPKPDPEQNYLARLNWPAPKWPGHEYGPVRHLTHSPDCNTHHTMRAGCNTKNAPKDQT